MKARDLMTGDPVTITPDATIEHAAAVMQSRGVCMLPVVNTETGARLRGVITDRDIVDLCVAEGHTTGCRVRDHWTATGLEAVHFDDPLELVIVKMRTGNVRRAPVVDADDRVVGVVTRADLVRRGCRGDPALRARILEQLSDFSPVTRIAP
jgi:acetoin utilization protein AcuB